VTGAELFSDRLPPFSVNTSRDKIVFVFGKYHRAGLPNRWMVPVLEDGTIGRFSLPLSDVRDQVKNTQASP
jgi:hypothetical protein